MVVIALMGLARTYRKKMEFTKAAAVYETLITSGTATPEDWKNYVRSLANEGKYDRLTAASVEALHAAGVKVFAWTANAPRDQERLAALGVDAVGTDDPQALLERWKGREPR